MANSLAWISGGSGWTPASEATLLGWWKADSLILSNNDPVSSWSDSSSNGYTMTQSGSQRPTYKTNIKNGLPAVFFDPNFGQLLQSSMPSNSKPFTVAMVVESAEFDTRHGTLLGSDTNGDLQLYVHGDVIFGNSLEADAQNVVLIANPSYAFSNGSWNIVVFNYDSSGNWTSMVNGSSQTGTNNQSFTGGGTTSMGAKGDTGDGFIGYIGEIMKFTSVVSTATIDTYLNGRWAVH